MGLDHPRTAVIVGASSGIGEALARKLAAEGWRVGIAARRLDRLESLAAELGGGTIVRRIDLADPEAAASALTELVEELGDVALVIISAGTGYLNTALEWPPDRDTLTVNVLGFAAVAQTAMRHFMSRRKGHLVGISSVAALRGNGGAAAYGGSKAFQSIYLDGLRDLARKSGFAISVTEIQPGFVDTAMMKTDKPLRPMIRRLLVATPQAAAAQIFQAIEKRVKHAYVTRRYRIIAFLLKRMPRPG
jgi:short-subunit dehydrogenase